MRINIDGKSYIVPEAYVQKLAEDLWTMLEALYETKIDDSVKVGLMAVTKAMLVKQEISARIKYGKEAARAFRPPGREDPTLWLAKQFLPSIKESLNDAAITCETESDAITAFNIAIKNPGDAGGQMDSAGSIGLRENDSTQVP